MKNRPIRPSYSSLALLGFGLIAVAKIADAASPEPPHIVFVIGEQEYQTDRTLREFAEQELVTRGVRCSFAEVSPDDPNDFPGLTALESADLMVLSVRRRTPKKEQMARIEGYLRAGKPIVGIRTASHAFDREPPDAEHVRWTDFDDEIFGGDYQGHYGNKPPYDSASEVSLDPSAAEHPILKGIRPNVFKSTSHLYKNRDLGEDTEVILTARIFGRAEIEPVSWTNTTPHGGRAFYSSLGNSADFHLRPFRLMLLNAMYWAMAHPVPAELRAQHYPQHIDLDLRHRDADSAEPRIERVTLPGHRIGIVAIDMWNWHWCKTSTMRVAALVPRMNRVLAMARRMGMQVFWCPTDAVNAYAGTHQREIAVATKPVPLPDLVDVNCPKARDGGGCTCGKERCRGNFGWDAMHPEIVVHDYDLMPNSPEILYALCRQRGITHLIYMGVHTQVCVLGKSVGVANMKRAGLNCILARDLTDAHGVYLPDENFTPDDLTQEVVEHFERYLLPTIDFVDELRDAGLWRAEWVVDPVRVAPWGTKERPHLFERDLVVTLTAPHQPGATIHYTLNGNAPTRASAVYSGPLKLAASTELRVVAYAGDREATRETRAYFARMNPVPPPPDVHLSDLEPLFSRGPGHSYSRDSFRIEPFRNEPRRDRANRGGPIRLAGKTYERGMGVHAVNHLVYRVKPNYRRFVALAGIDEEMLMTNHGSNLGRHPSVVFRVFIDGRMRAESPVMKIASEPWRFDVPIPEGSGQISLAVTDAGDGTKGDYADWADAGFLVE